ncbi:PASTA domain-containing protein [Myxococcota bacterium]|nr:PASTA domain-containing protein [Myxococcota bacterium]MBU1533970.1 PASTA domain-containing protein [Myxococcota bacterium]
MTVRFIGRKSSHIAPPTFAEKPTQVLPKAQKTIPMWRLGVVIAIPAMLLAFLAFSAFRIQVVNGQIHKKTVEKLSFTQKKLPTIRGFILDRRHHPLALPTELYSAAIDPMKLAYILVKNMADNDIPDDLSSVKDRKNLAFSKQLHDKVNALSLEIGVAIHEDPFRLKEQLFSAIMKGSRFMYLKRQIADEEVAALKKIKIKKGTIWFPLEPARHYPYRSLATQIIGFTSVDGEGQEGLERRFNVELKGSTSTIRAQRDAKSGTMLIKGLPDIEVGGANHVILTIDSLIQKDTERELLAGLELYKAKRGSAVVMDAKTGEILAMANVPIHDPSERHIRPADSWRNRAVVDAYELGSVVKPLTMAGALDSGKIHVDSDIPLDFKVEQKGKAPWVPKDHISISRGSIKPWEIIAHSSNIGISKISEFYGAKGLYHLFVNLGFGQETGIELPSEASGTLPPLKLWTSKINLATHAYGHGIALSLVQIVQAYTIFANDGYMLRPHIVRYVVDDRKQLIACYSPAACKGKRWQKRRILRNPKVAHDVLDMMRRVVTGGTGTKADLRKYGYSAAGKTGTAEKIMNRGRTYSQNNNLVTFVGLVPAINPRIIIAVMYDDPEGDPATFDPLHPEKELRKDAGYIVAPVFASIARRVLYRLGVPPDLEPIFIKKSKKKIGSTNEGKPYIPPLPTPEKVVMPNFMGKTLAATLQILADLKMDCAISGHGRVVTQYPEPGGPLRDCVLEMKPYVMVKHTVPEERTRESAEHAKQKNQRSAAVPQP